MSATRYAVALRPGRVQCWYTVRLPDGATIARYPQPEHAQRDAGLLNALADELDAIRSRDVDDRPGADFVQCHEHGIGCPCRLGGEVIA